MRVEEHLVEIDQRIADIDSRLLQMGDFAAVPTDAAGMAIDLPSRVSLPRSIKDIKNSPEMASWQRAIDQRASELMARIPSGQGVSVGISPERVEQLRWELYGYLVNPDVNGERKAEIIGELATLQAMDVVNARLANVDYTVHGHRGSVADGEQTDARAAAIDQSQAQQPWEMTVAEYEAKNGVTVSIRRGTGRTSHWMAEVRDANGNVIELKELLGETAAKIYQMGRQASANLFHEGAVEEALLQGAPVPPEVPADYPDMVQQHAATPPDARAAVATTVEERLADLEKRTQDMAILTSHVHLDVPLPVQAVSPTEPQPPVELPNTLDWLMIGQSGPGTVINAELARTTACIRVELGGKALTFSPGIDGPLDDAQVAEYCQTGYEPYALDAGQYKRIEATAEAARACATQSGSGAYFTCLAKELRKKGVEP